MIHIELCQSHFQFILTYLPTYLPCRQAEEENDFSLHANVQKILEKYIFRIKNDDSRFLWQVIGNIILSLKLTKVFLLHKY